MTPQKCIKATYTQNYDHIGQKGLKIIQRVNNTNKNKIYLTRNRVSVNHRDGKILGCNLLTNLILLSFDLITLT